jgi:type III restriction system methylase
MLELDCPLSSKIKTTIIHGKTVYSIADGYMMACFEPEVTDEVISEIAQNKPYYFVMRDNCMANDSVAVNFPLKRILYLRFEIAKCTVNHACLVLST